MTAPNRTRPIQLKVYLAPEEDTAIRSAAKAAELPLAQWIRAILARASGIS